MGQVMQLLWRAVGVEPLQTSVYNPQINVLVEFFNETLKRMLHKFALSEPHQWPRWLSHLLFAVSEVPQASNSFSPFELLYGWKPRGEMNVLREGGVGKIPSWDVRTYLIHRSADNAAAIVFSTGAGGFGACESLNSKHFSCFYNLGVYPLKSFKDLLTWLVI